MFDNITQDLESLDNYKNSNSNEILDLIVNNQIIVFFQPIYNANSGSIFGFEALTRIKDKSNYSIENLFKRAIETNVISQLELKIREIAISSIKRASLDYKNNFLFLNLTPEVLVDPTHNVGYTDKLADFYGLSKEKIVFEITEESAIKNFSLFKEAVDYYKKRGYKIAIDDFGAGYCGLKMLSIIEPDFLKIDKHFISQITENPIKQYIVESIITIAHKMGIKVIAEGIETEEELNTIINMDADLLQGFLLGRPSHQPSQDAMELISKNQNCMTKNCVLSKIGHISQYVKPIYPNQTLKIAYELFLEFPYLRSLPVIEEDKIIGSVIRNFFIKSSFCDKNNNMESLNLKHKIKDLMTIPSLIVDYNSELESVAQKLKLRNNDCLYDDIYVTCRGKYYGVVPVFIVLDTITERFIKLSKKS